MSMYCEYGETVRRALYYARYEANKLGASAIAVEHLLVGVLRSGDESFDRFLRHFALTPNTLRHEIWGPTLPAGGPMISQAELPLASQTEEVLRVAQEASPAEETDLPGVLYGILRVGGSAAARILSRHGVDLDRLREEIDGVASAEPEPKLPKGFRKLGDQPQLERFGRNLTAIAERGGFDPLIGRENELELVIQILSQRKKRNPILIGDPGVGKTVIVEGLAQRIVTGRVPPPLRDKRIWALDLAAMVAGTKFRGQFEERLKSVVGELLEDAGRSILFVDEIHTLVGAGATEGTLDAANILKPSLSRGEISCIGATTAREFRSHIEKDRALLRRFQPIEVDASTPEESLEILEGLRSRYEEFHQVEYEPEALRAAVYQSERYIPERRLPDKAIDLLDQAGARAQIEGSSLESPPAGPILVTRDQVEDVLSRATGIPLNRLQTGQAETLRGLEAALGRWVVGQDKAIASVARAIRRSRLGVRSPKRPIGSFFFVGPSGVGKTELARRLADHLFADRKSLLHYDMSEYMERHAVAKLIGSPPGYIGFEDGGQLTGAVRRYPYSVVLFDEIEKAHPEIANILLQILDLGRLTDSEGNVVDFTNTIVLMTSNVGTESLRRGSSIGFDGGSDAHAKRARADIDAEMKRVFRPEFLDRLDEIVLFESLGSTELRQILDLLLDDLNLLLEDRNLRVSLSDTAKDWLLSHAGINQDTGARPLRRVVEQWVEDLVSETLIESDGQATGLIEIDCLDDRLDANLQAVH